MPRGDGTGPMGDGPMTGWGRGAFAPYTPLSNRRWIGRRMGSGAGFRPGAGRGAMFGCGRGFGRFWWKTNPDADPQEMAETARQWQKENLEEEREFLKRRLDMIEAQLENGEEKEER